MQHQPHSQEELQEHTDETFELLVSAEDISPHSLPAPSPPSSPTHLAEGISAASSESLPHPGSQPALETPSSSAERLAE
jgi:hypothetical protein